MVEITNRRIVVLAEGDTGPAGRSPHTSGLVAFEQRQARGTLGVVRERQEERRRRYRRHPPRDRPPPDDDSPSRRGESEREREISADPVMVEERRAEDDGPVHGCESED